MATENDDGLFNLVFQRQVFWMTVEKRLGIFFHAFPLWMMTDSQQQNVREDDLDPTYFAIFEFDQWTVRDHDRNESGTWYFLSRISVVDDDRF